MASIRRRPRATGERYEVLFRDEFGRQTSRTFDTEAEAEAEAERERVNRAQELHWATCNCAPPRRIRVSHATLERGFILCAICGSPFA